MILQAILWARVPPGLIAGPWFAEASSVALAGRFSAVALRRCSKSAWNGCAMPAIEALPSEAAMRGCLRPAATATSRRTSASNSRPVAHAAPEAVTVADFFQASEMTVRRSSKFVLSARSRTAQASSEPRTGFYYQMDPSSDRCPDLPVSSRRPATEVRPTSSERK